MPQTESWTIGRLLAWTADYLREHDSLSPRLDAEVLLAEACGCARIELYTKFNELPADEARTAFRELVRRRAEGTPVAYLVGHREFYSLSFQVTPDVLIPRPETEFVVIEVLDLIKRRDADSSPFVVADVGTGSGNIGVSVARHAPSCRVIALDISPPALEVARRNVAAHSVEDRVEVVEGDLLSGLPTERMFDAVASNPPYVSEAEFEKLARDVKDHEPRPALVAGPRGTEIVARLIPQAAERLKVGGWLILEISPMIEPRVREQIAADSRFAEPVTVKDLAGLARVVKAERLES